MGKETITGDHCVRQTRQCFLCGRTWSFLLQIFLISSLISGSMASLNFGVASLINESWAVFDSPLKLRIGFRSKRFRLVAERWRFRVQQMSGKEHELTRSAKRSESLRQILKQYGISVDNPEENMTSSILDDLNCKENHEAVHASVIVESKMNTTEELSRQEKHRETVGITEDVSGQNHYNCKEKHDTVPSSVIDDSKMNTTEELRQQESTAEDVSGKNHHNLKTGALFTSSLLPVLGFCIVCIIGTLHTIIYRKTSRDHHHNGSKRTRWRTALSESNEPLASAEHDTSPEYKVGSAYQEATDEACSRVELEYKRFLLECGLSES